MNGQQLRNTIRNQIEGKKQEKQEAIKRRNNKWNPFYQSHYWKDLRAWKMAMHPLCEMHLKYGIAVPATSVHHKKPFGLGKTTEEKWQLLLDPLNLCSCCESCHDEFHRQLKLYNKEYIDEIIPVDCIDI